MSAASPALTDRYGIRAAAHAAAHPKPIYRFKLFWVLLGIAALIAAVRIGVDPLARRYTQKGIDGLTGYHGSMARVQVSFFPPAYTIEGLKLQQDGQESATEPVLYVKTLTGRLTLRELMKFKLVGTVAAHNLKATIRGGVTTAPEEVKEAGRKVEKEVKENDLNIGKVLQDLIPLRADRIEVRDSDLLLYDVTDPKRPSLWVSDVQLVIENLVTRQKLDQNVPLNVTMRAVVAKTGTLKILATADLFEEKPVFSGQAQLTGLQLKSLWAWTEAKAGVGAEGTVNAFVNFNSAKGKLSGDAKVIIENPKVGPATGKLADSLKAKVANLAISVLSSKDGGDKKIGTTLPLKGTLYKPDPQIWPTILGVVRNAFVESIDWGFTDLPTPTADKKQGLFDQAKDALKKNESGPKAQPRGEQ
ncbi:MAG: DUF748 domain-containing protein [Archangiaceae bacterium]|nr:DUF748 domain-containing protein [Archangiaceae bacterium]